MCGLAGRLAVGGHLAGRGLELFSVLGSAIRHTGGAWVSRGGGPVSRAGLREGRAPSSGARETIGHSGSLRLPLARLVKCGIM